MLEKKKETLVPARGGTDPFALLRQMTSELDRAFEGWPSFRWPPLGLFAMPESAAWSPKIDVFERDRRLVTRVDLPVDVGRGRGEERLELDRRRVMCPGQAREQRSYEEGKQQPRQECTHARIPIRPKPQPQQVFLLEVREPAGR